MKKILVFGSLNFDNIYRVPHITAAGETQASTDMTIRLGGKGYNQAAAACKSGGAVWLAGCIGTDGKPFLDACSKLGIHAELVKTVPDCKTGHAVIQVSEEGENSILLFGGANQRQDRAYIDHVLSKFDRGDYLMLQNEVNELPYLIDRAYEIGMKIVLNPSPFNDIILKCDLDKVSWLLVNEIECRQILEADCDEKPAEQLRRKYPGVQYCCYPGQKRCALLDRWAGHLPAGILCDSCGHHWGRGLLHWLFDRNDCRRIFLPGRFAHGHRRISPVYHKAGSC